MVIAATNKTFVIVADVFGSPAHSFVLRVSSTRLGLRVGRTIAAPRGRTIGTVGIKFWVKCLLLPFVLYSTPNMTISDVQGAPTEQIAIRKV
jgi:hypothetical protein